MEVLCIDIYEYNSQSYLTILDLFSNFPYCIQIADTESTAGEAEVKAAFDKFCATYAPPENIFSDNGKEFSLLEYNRDTTPANYPQANGKIERLHKEIGKLCHIHKIPPDEAIISTDSFKKSDLS